MKFGLFHIVPWHESRTQEQSLQDALEQIEQRLVALRAASRKYGVDADELPAFRQKIRARLELCDAPDGSLKKAQSDEQAAAARWRCPPDSCMPRSPTRVS